jgi:hypothetical protein
MPTRRSTRPRPSGALRAHSHLTGRDRDLLAMLDEHHVLRTDQVQRLFFTGLRRCRERLDVLRDLDLVDRFRFPRDGGGSETWKWTLGCTGACYQAATADRPAPTERAHQQHLRRLSLRPDLPHLLATNEFFVRLHHAARQAAAAHGTTGQTPTSGPGTSPVRLLRWWSEQTSAARFHGVHPDGHGTWVDTRPLDEGQGGPTQRGLHAITYPRSEHPHDPLYGDLDSTDTTGEPGGSGETKSAVGFFLECDTGSEALPRLIEKLDSYARLITSGGPRYPVLFWLPNTTRENNLQRLLRTATASRLRQVTVATATHDVDPAKRVWLTTDGWQRVRLSQLPSHHGIRSATNPNWRDGHLDLTDQRLHHAAR